MTILELIQAQCRAISVPEKYAEKIQKLFKIEKEEGIGTFVQMFKDNVLGDIQANEQENQTAAQTAISEYEKKHNLKDGKPVENKKPDEVDTTGLSPEVKALFENQQKSISTLTELVTGMAKTQQSGQKREIAKAKLTGKIDEDFMDEYLGRINLDAENLDVEVEAQIKNFTTLKQKFINKAVSDGSYTPANGAVSDGDFDSFISTKKNESEFKGVEL